MGALYILCARPRKRPTTRDGRLNLLQFSDHGDAVAVAVSAHSRGALVAAARHDAGDDSGWRVRPLELRRLHRDANFRPVERIVEAEVAGSFTLLRQRALQQVKVAMGRPLAQERDLEAIEGIEHAAAFAQSAGARFRSTDPLKRHERGDAGNASGARHG